LLVPTEATEKHGVGFSREFEVGIGPIEPEGVEEHIVRAHRCTMKESEEDSPFLAFVGAWNFVHCLDDTPQGSLFKLSSTAVRATRRSSLVIVDVRAATS
jgi:hypothetical protein